MSQCIQDEVLRAFRHGCIVDDAEINSLAQHLARCPACAARFEQIEDLPIVQFAAGRTPADDTHAPGASDTLPEQPLAGWDPPAALRNHPLWECLRPLGRGGVGEVYLARHRLQPSVLRALKLLSVTGLPSAEMQARFRQEIAVGMSLPPHENIVSFEFPNTVEEQPLLVMEYVPGYDLETFVAGRGGRLPIPEACGCVLQILAALQHAYVHHVVHRDLKPANVMITPERNVKVLDFGLAKCRAHAWIDVTQTGTGAQGSLRYCAPEQWRSLREADIRADLYSVGCTLYRLIAGSPPFEQDPPLSPAEMSEAHLKRRPVPLHVLAPQAPRGLSRLVEQLLAKNPASRPPTPADAARQLLPYADRPNRQRAAAWLAGVPASRRRPAWTWGLAACAALALSAGLWNAGFRRPPLPHPGPGVVPFSADAARDLQATWAARLQLPVTEANSLGMELVLIPPGEFDRGLAADDVARLQQLDPGTALDNLNRERPRHHVRLTQPFYLAACELTKGQLARLEGRTIDAPTDAELPVSDLTWFDALDLANRLSVAEGLAPAYVVEPLRRDDAQHILAARVELTDGDGYRLPTEAEWEFAARAGTATWFWFGEENDGTHANVKGSEPFGRGPGPYRGGPAPVRSYPANAFGLCDVCGNVHEWCLDVRSDDYSQWTADAVDPMHLTPGPHRVLRGGAWSNHAGYSRSGLRHAGTPDTVHDQVGVRLALPVEGLRRLLERQAAESQPQK